MAAALPGRVDVVGVVGAGTMGAGIAQLALEAGHGLICTWMRPPPLRPHTHRRLDRRASRLDLDPDAVDAWSRTGSSPARRADFGRPGCGGT
jgi:3-hydroxyacyl-CoA dehydrogenase